MALLNTNETLLVFATNIFSSKKNLESRIKGIFDSSRKKRGIITLIAVILFVIISGTIFNVTGAAEPEKISLENEFSDKQNDVINENNAGNENQVKAQIEENEFEIYNKFENSEPETLPATDNIQQDNTQQIEINQEGSIKTDEEAMVENDMSEIVIVDLNQLEGQLKERETVE